MKRSLPALLAAAALCACTSCPDEFPQVCYHKGCAGKVKELLAKDAALLAKPGPQGQFCLHLAADADIAEAALAAGADINQIAGTQQDPVGAAIYAKRADVLRVLLGKGAKVYDPQSLARSAAGNGETEVLEAFLDNGASVTDELLLQAVINDRAGTVDALLKRGANAKAAMGANMTMISFSAASGGAPPPQDVSGKTALQLARSDAVRELLRKAGAK